MTPDDCNAPECGYPEPHRHGFACDRSCSCGLAMAAAMPAPGWVIVRHRDDTAQLLAVQGGNGRSIPCSWCAAVLSGAAA